MKKQSIILLFILSTLTGCAAPRHALSIEEQQKKWDSLQNCVSEETLYQTGDDLQHAYKPLHEKARAVMPIMLKEMGLEKLEPIKGVRGVKPLTPDLCSLIFDTYNSKNHQNLSDRSCFTHLNKSANEAEDEQYTPLKISTLELDRRYVVLFIEEKKFQGLILFFVVHDLQTGRLMSIDTRSINEKFPFTHIVYQNDIIHFYWTPESFPGILDTSCGGKEVGTFNLKSGLLKLTEHNEPSSASSDAISLPEHNSNRWGYVNSLPVNGSGWNLTPLGANFYRSRTKLTEEGWKKLPLFLEKIGLSAFRSLRELGGYEIGNSKYCHMLYEKFNKSAKVKFSDDLCGSENSEETEYSWPLFFMVQQFDQHLILLVGEEGLGSSILFFNSYDLDTGEIMSADVDFLSRHQGDIFYKNDTLYFFNSGCTACDPRTECPSEKTATWDLRSGLFSVSKDATKYDCPN